MPVKEPASREGHLSRLPGAPREVFMPASQGWKRGLDAAGASDELRIGGGQRPVQRLTSQGWWGIEAVGR